MALWRLVADGRARLAVGPIDRGPTELLPLEITLDGLLSGADGHFGSIACMSSGTPPAPDAAPLPPCEGQEVWAAGVTFERSRKARAEESGGLDFYERVYVAERPELFLKAGAGRSCGDREEIGVRADSDWNAPEPELTLVLDARGEVVGYTIGNDVSSRAIEAENPLYLPQAKIYEASCALGPAIVPVAEAPPIEEMTVSMVIEREGRIVFEGSTELSELRRRPQELASWLWRAQAFPVGALLMTGTSIVPDLSLAPGDLVRIEITGLGELRNSVRLSGATNR